MGRQSARGGRHLGPHAHFGFLGHTMQPSIEQRSPDASTVAQQTHGPLADQGRRMCDEPNAQSLVEAACLVQRPQGGDGRVTCHHPVSQMGDPLRAGALGQDPCCHEPMPPVGMGQCGQESFRRFVVESNVVHERLMSTPQAEETPRRRVDLALVVLTMGDVVLVEIGDDHRPVRRIGQVDRPKRFVAAMEHRSQIAGAIGGAEWVTVGGQHDVVQWVEPPQLSLTGRWQCRALHHRQDVGEALERGGRSHPGQLPEGVWVARRTELSGISPLLEVVAALLVMPAAGLGAIVPAEEAAFAVQLQPKDISAALGKQLVFATHRVIAPHHATLEMGTR